MDDQTQVENIIKLQAEQKSMSEKLNDIKNAVDNGFKDIKEEFKCFREEMDKKYAAKPTEYIAYGFVAIVLSSFIGGLIYLVWR